MTQPGTFELSQNPLLSTTREPLEITIKGQAPITLTHGVPSVPLSGTLVSIRHLGVPWVYKHPSGHGFQAPPSHVAVVYSAGVIYNGLLIEVGEHKVPLVAVSKAKVHVSGTTISNLLETGPIVLYGQGSLHETLWNDGKPTPSLTGHLDYVIHQSVNWYYWSHTGDGKLLPGKVAITRLNESTIDVGGYQFVRNVGSPFYSPIVPYSETGGEPNETITFDVVNEVAGPWAVVATPTVGSSVLGTPVNPIPASTPVPNALRIRGSPNALEGLTATVTYTLGNLQFVVTVFIPSHVTGVDAPAQVATILNSSPAVQAVLIKKSGPPDPTAPARPYVYSLTITLV
jgi:hypothetical protein